MHILMPSPAARANLDEGNEAWIDGTWGMCDQLNESDANQCCPEIVLVSMKCSTSLVTSQGVFLN